jgi:para-nitrobenzyl esterase
MAKKEAPVVEIAHGKLRGAWKAKKSVAVFKGIPFAAPPVAGLRWRPPQLVTPWTGTRDAVKHGPMAIQRGADLELFMHNLIEGQGWGRARTRILEALVTKLPQPKQNEDCLYLTVRSPDLSSRAKLPVMVWIHGGDHQDGSGSDVFYEANVLASRGVVTVSINYRLGVMGYLAHPELVAESDHGVAGNYGTLDQIAALEWVRDNIGAFGGDADNVTIFGESAGGESVMHMMTSPLARGLFHKAISQSPANAGQMIHLDRPVNHMASGLDLGERFAAGLGVSGPDQIPRLRLMSPDQLYELARADREIGNHYPVIDGYVLPESPFSAFAAGRQAPVPLLIGSNANEGTLIRPLFGVPMADLRHLPVPKSGPQPELIESFGDDMTRLVEIYPGLDRQDLQAEIDFLGDHMFGAKAYYYVRHHEAAGHPGYLYMFSRTPKSPNQTAGAYHAADLAFVHGSNVPIFPMTAADKELSSHMIGYWTDFAKSADPNANGLRPVFPRFNESLAHWLELDHTIRPAPVSRREQYEIFNAQTDRVLQQIEMAPADV